MAGNKKSNLYYIRWLAVFLLGILLRLLSFNSSLRNVFAERIEVSTSLNSWKRVTEGVYLQEIGISPYDGDTFHEVPLALWIYENLFRHFMQYITILFIAFDVVSASLLSLTSKIYLNDMIKLEQKRKINSNAKNLVLKHSDVEDIPFYVFAIYLICPYTLMSCVGQSTTTLINGFMTIAITAVAARKWILASLILGLLTYHSIYPVLFMVPLVMAVYIEKKNSRFLNIMANLSIFCLMVMGLLYFSKYRTGSWEFIHSTYGAILSVPDLTPNIGLFWYFFTEMFEQFRVLFIWTFQINVFIYAIPLAIRFRSEPMLLFYVQLFMLAIFKSYPSLGDYAIPMALLPLWRHTFRYMRQSFLVGCILAVTFVLAPLLWHLWIYSGSANSNFYFGITLAFNTAQVFLITDLLFAHCKRDYHLEHGIKLNENGKPLRLDLK